MSALNSDDKKRSERVHSLTSSEGSYGQLIPSHHTPMVVKEKGIHSTVPPSLPPHLLNVNLNKQVPNVNEPSLLHEPNHVSVNHLYALSIKVSLYNYLANTYQGCPVLKVKGKRQVPKVCWVLLIKQSSCMFIVRQTMIGIAKDVNTSDLCGNTIKLIHVTPLLTITQCTCRPWLL